MTANDYPFELIGGPRHGNRGTGLGPGTREVHVPMFSDDTHFARPTRKRARLVTGVYLRDTDDKFVWQPHIWIKDGRRVHRA